MWQINRTKTDAVHLNLSVLFLNCFFKYLELSYRNKLKKEVTFVNCFIRPKGYKTFQNTIEALNDL